MPFVQGHLRRERLTVAVESACAHCGRALRLVIDGELRHRVTPPEAAGALVFVPLVDFARLRARSIIDDF
jgi:hypothetical protein